MSFLGYFVWIWEGGGLPCLFYTLTGLYCPGCGGTRAVRALLAGHPLLSFLYHPLVLYCAAVALWFLGSYFLYWRTKKEKYRLFLEPRIIYVGIGITILNVVVKDGLLIWKGIGILELLPKV